MSTAWCMLVFVPCNKISTMTSFMPHLYMFWNSMIINSTECTTLTILHPFPVTNCFLCFTTLHPSILRLILLIYVYLSQMFSVFTHAKFPPLGPHSNVHNCFRPSLWHFFITFFHVQSLKIAFSFMNIQKWLEEDEMNLMINCVSSLTVGTYLYLIPGCEEDCYTFIKI